MVDGQLGMVQLGVPPPGTEVEVNDDGYVATYDAAQVDRMWKDLAK